MVLIWVAFTLPAANADAHEIRMTDGKKFQITEMRSKITVIGVGGGGVDHGRAEIAEELEVPSLSPPTRMRGGSRHRAPRAAFEGANAAIEGLGAGLAEVGRAAAEESRLTRSWIISPVSHVRFVTAGMGGGTGTATVNGTAARQRWHPDFIVVTTTSAPRRPPMPHRGTAPRRRYGHRHPERPSASPMPRPLLRMPS